MKLPTHLHRHTLADLRVGQSTWTVPWAMYAEPDGTLYLNGNYSLHSDAPGGTVQMQVLRGPDGFIVDISRCANFGWKPTGACYVGGSDPLPVIQLIEH